MAIDREETLRRADRLLQQGRLDVAIAEYERVVEEYPSDWGTANALGDLHVRAGQPDLAAEQYLRIADHFFAEGFIPKAIALYKKVLKIRTDDERAHLQLAEASARQELLADARRYFAAVISARRRRGDSRGADEIVVRMGTLDPNDPAARRTAARAMAAMGNAAGAGVELRHLAAALRDRGDEAEARDVLREAVQLDPSDRVSRATLARACLQAGDISGAREYLSREGVADDPELLLVLAEIELRQDRLEEGRGLIRRVLELDRTRQDRVRDLSLELSTISLDAALACIEPISDLHVRDGEWIAAADSLQELVRHAPVAIGPLLRLVEICVDGGLEDAMYAAQARLADAYLAAGLAEEARVMAEDLVTCEPWEHAHVARLRQALRLLGEGDPEAVIAERLRGQTPFIHDDHVAGSRSRMEEARQLPEAVVTEAAASGAGEEATNLEGERVEVDLTAALEALVSPPPDAAPAPLDDVFRDLRDDVGRQAAEDEAERQWKLAQTCREMGMMDDAVAALRAAARSPRLRFEAAAALGRLYRERGMPAEAIEWFERAAEAPAATPADSRALLYDLGDTLEHAGETARALAVFLELAADAGGVRDVRKRIERLSRAQAGG